MTPISIDGGKQISVSLVSAVGVNPPADMFSGGAHIVRWTMVLRRPERSADAECAEECSAIPETLDCKLPYA